LALIVALIAGVAINMSLITLNTSVLFPWVSGVDMNDGQALNASIGNLLAEALFVVLLAHLVQSCVGG